MTTELWLLIFGPSSVVVLIAGAWAYVYKRSADTKYEQVRQDAAEAKEQANQITALTASIGRLADAWGKSDERSAEDRREFARIVEKNAEAKSELASAVSETNVKLNALPAQFQKGKDDAVTEVTNAMDTKLKPIETSLKTIQEQVSSALTLLHELAAERTKETDAEPVIDVSGDITLHAEPQADDTATDKADGDA